MRNGGYKEILLSFQGLDIAACVLDNNHSVIAFNAAYELLTNGLFPIDFKLSPYLIEKLPAQDGTIQTCKTVLYSNRYFEYQLKTGLIKEGNADLYICRDITREEKESELHRRLLKLSFIDCSTLFEFLDYSLEEAIQLTGSKIGFIYFYNEEKQRFFLNSWSKNVMPECEVMNPQTVYFLEYTGCWGEPVRKRKPVVINNYSAEHPMARGLPEGHVSLHRFMSIPVFEGNEIKAVIGLANKESDYDEEDVRRLTSFMGGIWSLVKKNNRLQSLQQDVENAREADWLKTHFLTDMSHSIRTSMNSIIGFAEMINLPGISTGEKRHFMDVVVSSSRHLLDVINDVLDISLLETGQLSIHRKPLDVHNLCGMLFDAFHETAASKGIQLFFETDSSLRNRQVLTDPERLRQVLTLLLENAIQYTEEKGQISFGYRRNLNRIEFFVRDSGIGIKEEKLSSLFQPFQHHDEQDSTEGRLGLSLAICKGIIKLLGGDISVTSRFGDGSLFLFTIPWEYNPNSKTVTNQSVTEQDLPESTKLVLIADDHPVNTMFLEQVLESNGYKTITAENGQDAVDLCLQRKDIDIVLMDMKMPVKDGFTATREIKKIRNELAIIAQTAYALPGDRAKALEAGCDDYLTKPIEKNLLLRMIKAHCR